VVPAIFSLSHPNKEEILAAPAEDPVGGSERVEEALARTVEVLLQSIIQSIIKQRSSENNAKNAILVKSYLILKNRITFARCLVVAPHRNCENTRKKISLYCIAPVRFHISEPVLVLLKNGLPQ
jgi:hypothetical protein